MSLKYNMNKIYLPHKPFNCFKTNPIFILDFRLKSLYVNESGCIILSKNNIFCEVAIMAFCKYVDSLKSYYSF